ncbi:MAG: DEAD/DEAH box helicase [Pseudomonadota bacterium]
MTSFDTLGLAEPILHAVAAEGYESPTPIQEQTIPSLLTGRDVLGIAQTGTGKTAAFVLPLLDRLYREPQKTKPGRIKSLILAPTRELAAQIADNIAAYGKQIRVRTAVVVGGVKPRPQIRALAGGLDILVATPGRLEDHVRSGAVSLDDVHYVVLDEADQMLDLGFIPAIRRILGSLPPNRQTVLFSATMPKQIAGLAKEFQNDPVRIAVAPAARPIDRIDQQVIAVDPGTKAERLAGVLRDTAFGRTIVFTRTKRGADRVAKSLGKAGFEAAAIHGDKSQNQRTRALDAFRDFKTPILVATDIAARGLDIDDVSHVVNYDLPNVPETYVHRIGRTARAGRDGVALTLLDPAERGLLAEIERLIGRRLIDDHAVPTSVDAPAKSGSRNAKRSRRPRKPAQRGAEVQSAGNSATRNENADRGDKPKRNGQGGRPKKRANGKGNGWSENGRTSRHKADRSGRDRATAEPDNNGLMRMLGA